MYLCSFILRHPLPPGAPAGGPAPCARSANSTSMTHTGLSSAAPDTTNAIMYILMYNASWVFVSNSLFAYWTTSGSTCSRRSFVQLCPARVCGSVQHAFAAVTDSLLVQARTHLSIGSAYADQIDAVVLWASCPRCRQRGQCG